MVGKAGEVWKGGPVGPSVGNKMGPVVYTGEGGLGSRHPGASYMGVD